MRSVVPVVVLQPWELRKTSTTTNTTRSEFYNNNCQCVLPLEVVELCTFVQLEDSSSTPPATGIARHELKL